MPEIHLVKVPIDFNVQIYLYNQVLIRASKCFTFVHNNNIICQIKQKNPTPNNAVWVQEVTWRREVKMEKL